MCGDSAGAACGFRPVLHNKLPGDSGGLHVDSGGFHRDSGGIPEGFRGIPGGFRGIPALEHVFRPYETQVQARENFRPSALIKIKETFEAQEPWPPRPGPPEAGSPPRPPASFSPS